MPFEIKNRFNDAVIFTASLDPSLDAALHAVRLGAAVQVARKGAANLSGAYLAGANLGGAAIINLIARVTRSDGHEFLAFATDNGLVIRAGCHTMGPDDYRAHVAANYPDTDKARETLDILSFIDQRSAR